MRRGWAANSRMGDASLLRMLVNLLALSLSKPGTGVPVPGAESNLHPTSCGSGTEPRGAIGAGGPQWKCRDGRDPQSGDEVGTKHADGAGGMAQTTAAPAHGS